MNLIQGKISEIIFKTIEGSDIFCLITDSNGKILYSNEGALKITNRSCSELTGESIYNILLNSSEIESFLNTQEIFKGYIQGKQKSGKIFYLYSEIYPIKTDGNLSHFIYIGEKLLEKEKLEEFHFGEEFDIITGLPHKKAFSTVINTHIERYHEPLTLLLIDIYSFSQISLSYGRDFAEALLKQIADRLKKITPKDSFIAKTETDEFLVILFKTSKNKIASFIMDLFAHFYEPFIVNEKSIIITLNIGISSYPQDGKNDEELLTKAIVALGKAKKEGENTFFVFEENLEKDVRNHISLKEQLAKILKERGFLLFAQPYFLTTNKEISGAEILLRISHNGNIESIANVIEFLETSGLILKVEDYLFEEIKKFVKNVRIPLSINISSKSLASPDILSKLRELREYFDYPFICEITERLFMEKSAIEKVNKIKELDIKIAIDDFGTGYSSLSYIENLPVDIIKIDISFIKRMLNEPRVLAIVQTIIDLAKKLNIKTIAEGVENEDEFRILRLLMCDYVQGYYLSKPAPIEYLINLK